MNKGIIVLGIFVLAAMAFAATPIYNQYMYNKMINAGCQYNLFVSMNTSTYGYNHSYNGQMATIKANMITAGLNMIAIYCAPPHNDISSFNSQYNQFGQYTSQASAIFFRAATDATSGDGITWLNVFSTYHGYQDTYQACLLIHVPVSCPPPG